MRPSTILPHIALLQSQVLAKPTLMQSCCDDTQRDLKDICAVIEVGIKVVDKTPADYTSEVMYTIMAGTAAYGTCEAIMPENWNSRRCAGVGLAVSSIVGTIALGVVNYRERQGTGTEFTKRYTSLASFVEDDLVQRGSVYESISSISIAPRDGTNIDRISVQVLGLRAEDGTTTDQTFHFGADGSGAASVKPHRPLGRRDAGYGFKISYRFLKIGESDIDATAAGRLSESIGQDWESRATESHDLNSYFGRAEFTEEHVMAFRIVPTDDIGDIDFADVDVCGKIEA